MVIKCGLKNDVIAGWSDSYFGSLQLDTTSYFIPYKVKG